MYRSIISAISCLGLAACGGTTTGGGVAGAQSGGGFAISNSAPAPQLPPPSILGGSLTPTAGSNTGSVTLAQGGGYTYQVDYTQTTSSAQANVASGLSVRPVPTSGGATLNGFYDVYHVTGVGGATLPSAPHARQPLSLIADFAAGTLTGGDGDFAINGTFSSNVVTGTSSYKGVGGSLQAIVSSDQAVGAFAGAASDASYSGGFTVIE